MRPLVAIGTVGAWPYTGGLYREPTPTLKTHTFILKKTIRSTRVKCSKVKPRDVSRGLLTPEKTDADEKHGGAY